MTEGRPVSPPPELLRAAGGTSPEARTVVAEVRSNATIWFDPKAAPGYLQIRTQGFGALMLARLDASWEHAKRIQDWLVARPPQGMPESNQEEALKNAFEALETGDPPATFVEYIGTYLTGDQARARFSMLLGFRQPVARERYHEALADKLRGLQATAAPWYAALIEFLRLYSGQATSTEEFLMLASTTGSLKDPSVHPVISQLIP
jgi:hypothetical protein